MEEDTLSDIYAKGTVSTQWVAGSHYLAYSQRGNYFIVDANTGRQEPLVANVEAFAKNVATLTGDTAVRAGDLRVTASPCVAATRGKFIGHTEASTLSTTA